MLSTTSNVTWTKLPTNTSNGVTTPVKTALEQVFVIEGEKRVVEAIVGRRKLKQSYEYEVSWVGRSSVDNTWISRSKLEEMGFDGSQPSFDCQGN
ncbi:hypothetical protein G6F68_020541 [Rhizopus microsporus]|nr:hypothetical protein G6F68_020541 [Rhizopus microsporus]